MQYIEMPSNRSEEIHNGPMKILALVTDGCGGRGGIARFNQDFLEALSAARSDISVVILPRTGPGSLRAGAAVRGTQKKAVRSRFLYALRGFSTAIAEKNFKIIFCGHLYMAPLAVFIGKILRIPVWLQIHGIEAWGKPAASVRWAVRSVSLVTAVSRYTRKRFLSWSGISPFRVKILPDTVNERFTCGGKPVNFLKRNGLENKKILLTVSRLAACEKYKGHESVMDILSQLKTRHPDLVYVIAGDGDDRGRLEQAVEEKKLKERVRFLGWIGEDEKVDLYRAADGYLMPSTGEGFGIAFLEAMACGVPALGLNCAGSTDALQEGSLGHASDKEHYGELVAQWLDRPGPCGPELSSRVLRIFGKENFCRHISRLLGVIEAP